MTGRFCGLKNAMTQLVVLGALGVVVALSAQGRDSNSDFKAAPDDPEHAKTCVVCRSSNHFGGRMPGPAPSDEVLNRMFAADPYAFIETDKDAEDLVSDIETIETASDRNLRIRSRSHQASQPSVIDPRTNVRKASAS